MTHAPRGPRLEFRSIEDVVVALREAGGRFSAPRRQVLEALFAADGPVSAEELAGEGMDLGSVYRALEYLEELGAVRHVHFGHGPGLYALTSTGDREYLLCERCDRVTAVDAVELDGVRAEIERAFGYRASFTHFPITGLCAACVAQSR